MNERTVTLREPWIAAILAWMLPGLGHWYQGRTGKAILYAVCILGLYLAGMWIGEGRIVYWRWVNPFNNPEKFCIYYIGQFFVGLPSLPALIQGTLRYFDHDPILWGIMAEPPQTVINGLLARIGKPVEIGTIYTTVAGLLNILAIYDAYEGPAFQDYEEEPARGPSDRRLATAATGELNAEGSA
jgi:hypothetical protein